MGANQQCTIESSGRITVNTPAVENIAAKLSAGSTLVNRGTITATSVPHPTNPNLVLNARAFGISGARSKVINYGNIYFPEGGGVAFDVLSGADNVEIEFLSGSLIAGNVGGGYIVVDTAARNTKLTFGGNVSIAAASSSFLNVTSNASDVVILLPGATIHTGDRLRPFAGLASIMDGAFANDEVDVLKIGNFYEGDEPLGSRTGWVHAGQWYFGEPGIAPNGTDELIVDTNPGVRFSIHGGVNHYRSGGFYSHSAIYGLDNMRIRSGNVVLGGSVYMPMGTVYVHDVDGGRLTFEIGKRRDAINPDSTESPERVGEMIISRLVAKELIFTGSEARVFIQFAHYLSASDIAEFRIQLDRSNFAQLDATTQTLDGDDNRLSKILRVEKVSYLANYQKAKNPPEDPVDITDYVNHMKVMSSGRSGNQLVGHIIVKSGNNADIGRLLVYDPENIGQLRYSSVVTGRTPVSSGTGGGTPSTPNTPSTPSTPGGEDETGEGETGEGETGEGETGEGETKLAKAKLAKAKLAQVKPAQAKLAKAKLAQVKPAQAKPAQAKPAKAKPAQAKPAKMKPAKMKPAKMKPAKMKPAKMKPAKMKPAKMKPAQAKPAQAKPAQAKPAQAKPAKAKPAKAKPAKAKPAKAKPAKAKPAKAKPAKASPAKASPAKVKPAKAKPATNPVINPATNPATNPAKVTLEKLTSPAMTKTPT